MLRVRKLFEDSQVPVRQTPDSAGYDLFAHETVVVRAGAGAQLVKTGVAVAVPPGTYGRVAARSGLAVKHSLAVGAGVIDADYRGEVGVVLFNLHPSLDYTVPKGSRIAQLVLEQIVTCSVLVVASLEGTERDAKGFGSTG